MALNVKLIQEYALKVYKEYLKYIKDEELNPEGYSFKRYIGSDYDIHYNGSSLPFCCSVDEVSYINKNDLTYYVLYALALEYGPKYIIHISDKNQKQYQHYLDLGFEVTKHYMGNHKKMLTWLELDLTKYTF